MVNMVILMNSVIFVTLVIFLNSGESGSSDVFIWECCVFGEYCNFVEVYDCLIDKFCILDEGGHWITVILKILVILVNLKL